MEDLHPATWYVMKVNAHSDAGSTESQLKFATLNYHGRKSVCTHLYSSLLIVWIGTYNMWFLWSKNKFIGTCIDIPIIGRNDVSYVPTVHMSIIHMWFVLTDTITPLFITKKEESNFYEKTYIMIPLCFGIVAFLILIIAVLLYMRRRRELIQMKGKVKFTIPGDV